MESLVSIIVVSYNSGKYIYETLESISKQTYKNIEIILCDDGSIDNSVEIFENFKFEFKIRKIVLKSKVNKGIPNNINKGIKEAKGKYIKFIAADDILTETCIERNIEEMVKDNRKIQYSKVRRFYEEGNKKVFLKEKKRKFHLKINNMGIKEQLIEMLYANYISAPTVFISKELIKEVGLFDEKYTLIEDYPMWIKILMSNKKISFLDEVTVYYRHSNESLVSGGMSEKFKNQYVEYISDELIPLIKRQGCRRALIRKKRDMEKLKNGKTIRYILYTCIDYGSLIRKLKNFI